MVKQIGEGWGQAVVVFGSNKDKSICSLDYLPSVLQNLWGLGLVLVKMEGFLQ